MHDELNNGNQQSFPPFELPDTEVPSDTLEVYSINPRTIIHSFETIGKRTWLFQRNKWINCYKNLKVVSFLGSHSASVPWSICHSCRIQLLAESFPHLTSGDVRLSVASVRLHPIPRQWSLQLSDTSTHLLACLQSLESIQWVVLIQELVHMSPRHHFLDSGYLSEQTIHSIEEKTLVIHATCQ